MSRLFLLIGLSACGLAALAEDIPPPRPKVDVAALVRQLASDDFAEREEAEQQLAALRVKEPPVELLAALKSPNPEVRERAAKAIKSIRAAAAHSGLARDERFAARGQVDLYVASTVALDPTLKDEDERLWMPAIKLGDKVVAAADTTGDRKPRAGPIGYANFATYRHLRSVEFVRTGGLYCRPRRGEGGRAIYDQAIQAQGVEAAQSISGLVVSRGPVRAKVSINSAFILATGDVAAGHDVHSCVIVCDGDVTSERGFGTSVVIARGNITTKGGTGSSTLIAGGTVKVGKLPEPIPLQEDPKQRMNRQIRVIIKEKDINPLGLITFFELSQVGLEVKVADNAAQVAKVAPGSASAKAGLKAGDTLLDVGGKKPADAEALRRLLRDALAVGDAALKFKRGGETLTVKLALPD